MSRKPCAAAVLLAAAFVSLPAAASCGSAYCVLNTQWDTQGVPGEPGKLRLDLRYEYLEQDQLREGKRNISPAEDPNDHLELQTANRNLLASLDYSINANWGISAALPVVKRNHSHIDDPSGAAALETWDFTRAGDARVLGRYRFDAGSSTDSFGLQFGVKLPTGDFHLANADGEVAERSLQPGSGSTDLIAGAYYAYRPRHRGLGWFGQLLVQHAVATKEDFRPGDQISLTGGLNYPVGDQTTLLFQLNGLVKRRDTGANAEPESSGGRFLYASPGASFAITPDTQVYGFVQLPLLRDVNGIQRVARQALVAGLSVRF